MNLKNIYEQAAAAGISPFETRIRTENKISVGTFNDKVENFVVAGSSTFKARGVVDGKCGVFSSDGVDKAVIAKTIDAIKDSAEFGQPVDTEFFISGGDYTYKKLKTYNAALAEVPASRYIELAKSIAKKARALDKRLESVEVQVEYQTESSELKNSNGLNVKQRTNYCMVFAGAKAVENGNVESGSHYAILSALDGFDEDAFAAKLVETTVGQLGGASVPTGKYKVVYAPECVASLLMPLGAGFSAFAVEQHLSLIEGKVGTQAFSKHLTVQQTPIGTDVFCSAFDDEGVPCQNTVLIDKGVPTGYVYDLATAKRAGVKSTGNARLEGGNSRPAVGYVTVKPGKKSLEELFEEVGDGLYITDLGGLHSGLNPQSGDYSVQGGGYLIKNGKKDRPVSLITVAGNIITDFADIGAVGSDTKLTYYGVKTPSIIVNSLSVSGKE